MSLGTVPTGNGDLWHPNAIDGPTVPGGPLPASPLPLTDALHEAFSAITHTMNLAIAFNWRWGIGAPIGHRWTLGVEGNFYLVWGPLLTAVHVMGGLPLARARQRGGAPCSTPAGAGARHLDRLHVPVDHDI